MKSDQRKIDTIGNSISRYFFITHLLKDFLCLSEEVLNINLFNGALYQIEVPSLLILFRPRESLRSFCATWSNLSLD